jgi:type I restriction enzyme R subunit
VLYSDDSPPVDQYDCIVVDECHRGYNLDREMSDQEMSFRSELDYISTYRRVLDHFDAVKIGLTATPAKHTIDIFGEPVFTYSYRQAVIDDKLVDHEPPYRIVTELNEDGMKWVAGDTMKLYRTRTGDVVSATTPDEVHIEVESFNKKVITESFNQTVCAALAEQIDPSLPGKTLVFCATDRHADMVVRLLNEAFANEYGAVDNDAVTKITGTADKPNQQIRNFKNEGLPSVVVTVDLLTTGIDVPAIVNLVFLRRVRSRIPYEQMLERATRLCKPIGKRYFRIYDAVDLYAALLPHTSMKFVVVNPKFTFKQLVNELVSLTDDTARSTVRDELVAKMLRKVRALTVQQVADFQDRAGKSTHQVLDDLRTEDLDACVDWWKSHGPIAKWLDDAPTGEGPVQIISGHQDTFRRIERGFKDGQAPKDYLESFDKYVRSHLNDMPALKLIAQRPRDLTRADLRALKLALDEAGYTEASLFAAWTQTTNQDIAATIIGFIRRGALGSPLIPYEDRVKAAMNRVLASRSWKPAQRKWLERIGKQLAIEKVLDRKALDSGSFKTQGGFKRLNKVFDGELERLLGDIGDAVWDDVG